MWTGNDQGFNEHQLQIVTVTSILLVISTVSVALRLLARRVVKVPLYPDDYVIVVALFLSYGNCICEYVGVQYGLGKHASEVGQANAGRYMLVLYVLQLFWNTTLPVVKTAILLFYRRVFPVRSIKLACTVIQVFLIIWYLAFQLTAIFQCFPIHKYWLHGPGGYCIQFIPFYTALASTNVITDVILLVLPMPEIYKLQIPWQKKIGLVVVFTLGIFVCAIAVYRITTLKEIDPKDITWSNTYAGLWTAIEGSVGVTVACLPSSVPVFLQAFGKYRRERSQRSNYGSHGRGTQHSSKAMWSRTEHDGFNKMDNLSLNSGEEHSLGFKVGPTAGVERNTDQRSIPLQGIVVTRAIDQEVD